MTGTTTTRRAHQNVVGGSQITLTTEDLHADCRLCELCRFYQARAGYVIGLLRLVCLTLTPCGLVSSVNCIWKSQPDKVSEKRDALCCCPCCATLQCAATWPMLPRPNSPPWIHAPADDGYLRARAALFGDSQ